jgi:hypothetical protein
VIEQLWGQSPQATWNRVRRKLLNWQPLPGFSENSPCVFALSTGRTGTATLASLLGLATNVSVYHEPLPRLFGLSRYSYLYQNLGDQRIETVLKEALLVARGPALDLALSCHKGYVETSPQGTFLAPLMEALIPEVRFIHVIRDPRDVVRSGMRRKWFAGNPNDVTRIVPRQGTDMDKAWHSLDAFEKNLWLWAETNNWIADFLQNVPQDRRLTLRAEDIFSSTESTIAPLFAFLHSPLPSKQSVNRIMSRKLNAQKSGAFVAPSDWSEEMLAKLRVFAGPTAERFGYVV